MQLSFQSKVARSGQYRADIDGLRALAVLPVVFYHAKVAGFSGGFVGVDVFYVISGYLITSLILKDEERGRFSLVSFYERRIRRIFPALFGVIFFCTIVAAILFAPRDLVAFGKSMLAMTFFASNILFKREGALGGGYFGNAAQTQALLHTWSLSVEEQFYLFFPTVLLLLTRWTKRRAKLLICVIAVISFATCIVETKYRPISAFYIFIPRAWELLLGALLAMKAVPALNHRVWREIAGVAGVALIAWAVFLFSDDTAFPGAAALVPCVGAALVIYAGESGPSWAKSALSFGPLVFVGVISYSLYLWHWPLIVFTRYFSATTDLTGTQTVIVIVCSVVLAFVSFEFIEGPFRGSDSRFSRKQIFALGATASVLSACLALAIYVRHGFPGRYDAQTAKLVLENTERKDDFQEVCGNWKKQITNMADINFCALGPDSAKKIMFWGDSHVQQLYPVIQRLYSEEDFKGDSVVLAIANGCLPVEHLNTTDAGYHCGAFAHYAMQRAQQSDIDSIFIGFNTWWTVNSDVCESIDDRCVARITPAKARILFLKELTGEIHLFRAQGKRVIVSLPFPMYDKSIPDLEIRNAIFGKFGLSGAAKDITLPAMREEVLALAMDTGADVFDPRKTLCNQSGCIVERDGVSIYKDDNHIVASQIAMFEGNLKQVFLQ
jgi:peptidoglycan/LPS O-acetylase OafA/YrhL